MKLNDVKHNHSLTDLLKILIFSILMMIPFIDVGVRCAYVVCNKNAYQSYSDLTNTTYTQVTNNDNEVENLEYRVYMPKDAVTTLSQSYLKIGFNEISIDIEQITGLANINAIMYHANGYVNLFEDDTQRASYGINDGNGKALNFLDTNIYFKMNTQNTAYRDNYQYVYQFNYTFGALDNVFDYSVNKLTTSELYTWTQQTAIYTGVQTMCTQLGINNSVIPLLLVYWFILTVIYIIIDIVLKLFTMLTHAIGSKTA